MTRTWPEASILDAIALCEAHGRSIVTLTSVRDAMLFRTAIYNYRRKYNRGAELVIHAHGCDVILTLPEPSPQILDVKAAQ